MFNLALQEKKIDHNPVSGKGIMFRENNKVGRTLSITEEARLYEVCQKYLPRYFYWIVFTGLNTGMRRGEILNLKWKNVDLVNRMITIDADIAKNAKERMIPINNSLTALLKKIKDITVREGEYVFTGTKPLKEIRTGWSKAKRLAGLHPKLRFHDLRHTVTSKLVTENHVDLVTVAEILGHSSLKMLERYAHSRKDIKSDAVETLSKAHEASQLHTNCIVEKSGKTAIIASPS